MTGGVMRVSITSHIRSPGPLSAMKARRWHLDTRRADAFDPLGGVADPAPSSDVVVEPGVAVDENIDPGPVLGRDVAGKAVEMLFAIACCEKPCDSGMPRRFSVYQLGRGRAPVVVVSNALPLVMVSTALSYRP